MRKKSSKNTIKFGNGRTNIKLKQGASASIGQGGNAIAINASEIGVVRIRPGQQ
ncbi:hypothetical protein FHS15_004797 [Paenibacillus castaneae]|uniref:hypothetical protein n=1 Tax=Paenibacillus castaneae TaxID=474957 RepID=UPI00141B488B|nr:hypothetical protein [Paenibacillus castaneae]NIK79636.1 hypothetical protein [Paenibacillus castaneae]